MEKNIIEYTVLDSANKLNSLFHDEIKRKTFNKKFNLAGEHAESGGLNLYSNFSFSFTEPYFGPLVKLNLKTVSVDIENNKSKLILKRINGDSYLMQRLFSVIFIIATSIIVIYQISKNGFLENIELFSLPIVGLIYYFIIELISISTFNRLCKKVEWILKAEKVDYYK